MSYHKSKDDCTIYFDVDQTLIWWNEGHHEDAIEVKFKGNTHKVRPHKKHLQRINYHYERNHVIILWSQSGSDWAETVAKKLGIIDKVDFILTKPYQYYDDLDCKEWMGNRVYYGFRHEDEDINNEVI